MGLEFLVIFALFVVLGISSSLIFKVGYSSLDIFFVDTSIITVTVESCKLMLMAASI